MILFNVVSSHLKLCSFTKKSCGNYIYWWLVCQGMWTVGRLVRSGGISWRALKIWNQKNYLFYALSVYMNQGLDLSPNCEMRSAPLWGAIQERGSDPRGPPGQRHSADVSGHIRCSVTRAGQGRRVRLPSHHPEVSLKLTRWRIIVRLWQCLDKRMAGICIMPPPSKFRNTESIALWAKIAV